MRRNLGDLAKLILRDFVNFGTIYRTSVAWATAIHSFQGRKSHATTRKPYSTDLTDAEWSILQPLLKLPTGERPKTTDLREVINAIRYRLKTGCQWRLLPHPCWIWVV